MTIHPDYELADEIGRGRHSIVYRGIHKPSGDPVAVKQFESIHDPVRLAELNDTVALFADLPSHDHLVRIRAVVPENGWLVMDLMKESLAGRLATTPNGLPIDEVEDALRGALNGLAVLHAAGRSYGDIQPSNLLVDIDGQVRLGDSPGLMTAGGARPPEGLPRYLAPERLDPTFGPVGPAADMYALGFVMIHLLTGPRFDGLFPGTGRDDADPAAGWKQLHGSPSLNTPLADLVPGVPPAMARLIDAMIRKPVSFRCPMATEALKLLSQKFEPPAPTFATVVDINLPTVEPETAPPPAASPRRSRTGWLEARVRQWSYLTWGLVAVLMASTGLAVGIAVSPARPETVNVTIATEPADAEITFLDRSNPDKPPSKTRPPGPYVLGTAPREIRVAAAGYRPRTLTIDPTAQTEYSVVLEQERGEDTKPTPVAVTFVTEPKDVAIAVLEAGGAAKPLAGKNADGSFSLLPQPVRIRITAPGYQPREETIDPRAQARYDFALTRIPTDRRVRIESAPAGATVTILGRAQAEPGVTPAEYVVPREAVVVSIRRPGFAETRHTIPAGESGSVRVVLDREAECTNSVGMTLRWVPPGQFVMGTPEGEPGEQKREQPTRAVKISRGFYVGKYEVTQAQFLKVMGDGRNPANPAMTSPEDLARFPVNGISYVDAAGFIKKLNEREPGRRYRLPTEAEWEYACRAGTTGPFSVGATLAWGHAAFDASRPFGPGTAPSGSAPAQPAAVGTVGRPNAFGLHDMHGNLWEWVADWYAPYPPGNVTDPRGPATGTERVLRGGSYRNAGLQCRSAHRETEEPNTMSDTYGFRVVLEVDD